MKDRKEYMKAWKAAHKETEKAKIKAWKELNKETEKAKFKAWYEEHKEYNKAYNEANKDKCIDYYKAYKKADVNALGQTKQSIRMKSYRILRQMNLRIDGYQIHHCFGYEDAYKFIYISKELHVKIHKYLRDNNISANSNHWMAIRDIVNDTNEFTYIKY